ncbi:MAG: poly-gamma-glutamate synthase PgsB [Eggerthella lenta]
MGTAVVGVFVIAAFAAMGALERFRNGRALRRMPLRVNVNGIRGKSTVTRLVTAILAEEGYNVVGKTTGTAARMIYGLDREEPIVRKPEGANIKEQVVCIDKAARHGANAMVCECMAVRPEYQTVVQERMLRANVCVIVNILEDHLDVMGPTELQIAEAFSKSIPRRGYCVTVPGPYLYVLERECVKRGSELVVVDESEVPEEYIARFPYEIFPANVALAIGVARVLGISREVAERGALLAKPDPGAAQIVDAKDNDLVFVNGFAANEPSSSWTIWDRMESKGARKSWSCC